MSQQVFISYKREDVDFANNLMRQIEKEGFTAWIDSEQLRAGQDWVIGIDTAIQNCFAVIVILTPQAKMSDYVTYEWSFALGLGKTVIPILKEKTDLHPRLIHTHSLDFTGASRPWHDLIKRLRELKIEAETEIHLEVDNQPTQRSIESESEIQKTVFEVIQDVYIQAANKRVQNDQIINALARNKLLRTQKQAILLDLNRQNQKSGG
jgi:putative protein kinase ArgK-like GTPase of G3E family